MDRDALRRLLEGIREGRLGVDEALERLRAMPFEDAGIACVDHHRGLRKGLAEVIFGQSKEVSEIGAIMERMLAEGDNILVTRLSPEKASLLRERFKEAEYHQRSGVLMLLQHPPAEKGKGTILVVSAGTSDLPVAEEAALTARFMGNRVETLYDVGVSGLHRLLGYGKRLWEARVIVVVAGMEGALPSVVGGLVDKPVVAVPTSVGYGASFQGVAALLGMLNTCAAGVTVVNIDNGFGAGYAASLMNRL